MDPYLNYLKEYKAEGKYICPSTVFTAPWTIYKCQYGCGRYGKSHCCPPASPGYKQTREILDAYEKAILFTTTERNATEIAVNLCRIAFLDGYYKAIAFGSGPCNLCKTCNPEGCNFPEKAVPAMEACGIDVFATARQHGFPISVLREKGETHHHFGLVLLE